VPCEELSATEGEDCRPTFGFISSLIYVYRREEEIWPTAAINLCRRNGQFRGVFRPAQTMTTRINDCAGITVDNSVFIFCFFFFFNLPYGSFFLLFLSAPPRDECLTFFKRSFSRRISVVVVTEWYSNNVSGNLAETDQPIFPFVSALIHAIVLYTYK